MKLLDLYCCAGGAAAGYAQAGFDVTGIDIVNRKNYPFKFIQADAIEYLLQHGHKYDFIHASPPCQLYSNSTAVKRKCGYDYPDLIEPTRQALKQVGKHYVIENVLPAPLRPDLILRGDMFGLKVIRKRKFELGNWYAMQAGLPSLLLSVKKGSAVSVYGSGAWRNSGDSSKRHEHVLPEWRLKTIRETWLYALDIHHFMTIEEVAESLPPAYTKYIGELFIQYLKNKHQNEHQIN